MDSLKERGFPPVFIFMYDQMWLMLLQIFRIAARLLESSSVEMSLACFAWALESGTLTPGVKGKRVGNNFGQPHRDKTYDKCHTEGGKLRMVTTWVPLVPATMDNGCMYVLPAESDPVLSQPDHPSHKKPEEDLVLPQGVALPCEAGSVLAWKANLVHWGSACAADVSQPRKSFATAFMLPGTGKLNAMETISKDELIAGLSMQTRLRIIIKSLLQYKSWYPDFAGMSALADI
eukprot:TRINITY_DN21603_c0_g1_i1.p1 TRINITY_DN21603_c0_g1~~TRINITY_DN21603_c0_g1_i1.p1  ORF type:complete len:233 (-),score=45.54 TRINITY_DN21603_c0_g1_i1:436-1134(-)